MTVVARVTFYDGLSGAEAVWTDEVDVSVPVVDEGEVIGTEIETQSTPIRCHSYAASQMDMLRADLGDHAAEYEDEIAAIEAAYQPPTPASAPVPASVSRFQASAALWQMGFLDDVEAYMALETTDMMARLAWAEAQEFRRDSVFVKAVLPLLGINDAQADDLFRFAATIAG